MKITITLNDDGSISLAGDDSPAAKAWCWQHQRGLSIALLHTATKGDTPIVFVQMRDVAFPPKDSHE